MESRSSSVRRPSGYYTSCGGGGGGNRRLSMLSNTKYKHKEERKKVLRISVNKLKAIEDPESTLCRSVLINNTMKRLQNEVRDEKNSKFRSQKWSNDSPVVNKPAKRNYEHVDEVKDFLKDMYMPPTPISSIDDDHANAKKLKVTPDSTEECPLDISNPEANNVQSVIGTECSLKINPVEPKKEEEVSSVYSGISCYDNSPAPPVCLEDRSSVVRGVIPDSRWFYGDRDKNLSCGQTSMFGELQSVVYHSLITSLES